MARVFIKFGLINTLCIINLVAVLLLVNQWFAIKPFLFKTIIITIALLGVLFTVLMSLIPNNALLYEKAVDVIYNVSLIIFGICVVSAIANIYRFGIKRGTELYDIYSLPALFPAISGVILYFIRK
jgi:hypothetical protein